MGTKHIPSERELLRRLAHDPDWEIIQGKKHFRAVHKASRTQLLFRKGSSKSSDARTARNLLMSYLRVQALHADAHVLD